MHLTRLRLATSLTASTIAWLASAPAASAQEAPRQRYHLPVQPLAVSLDAVAKASGRGVLAPSRLLEGKQAPALDGEFTSQEAVDLLLSGSGLHARLVAGNLVIGREARSDLSGSSDASDVVVTGSRIRGAPIASPVITLTAEAIQNAGQTNLGDVARSIPQSFGGGQNPGIGISVPGANGVNVGGGSTVNLRGLGSDATLTLLNGHRLTYTGGTQGVDVSAIPLGAVDRMEIVADGSSALYGSDAVAGVVNIILKRDYSGLETRARYGAATQGTYSEQQYGAVAGDTWRSGGVMVAYEYASNTDIQSTDRSFAQGRPGVTIYPAQHRHAVTVAGHQSLTDMLTFEFDGLYNKRWNVTAYPQNAAGDLSVSRVEQHATAESWAVSPSLKLALSNDWRVALSGTYGREDALTRIGIFAGAAKTSSFVCYCNTGRSAELAADGPLFRLPGGSAKVAVGGGYRYNGLSSFRGAGDLQNVDRSQGSYYGYGELSLPLVSPDLGVPGVHRLNVSGALRYERYPGMDSIATPKLGLIYAPSADVDLKASWGKSFRAPTLIQQYQARLAYLYTATAVGGTGLPAGTTALVLRGGNPDLKPERATTWTASLDVHPRALPGLRVSLSYFSTRYQDRIVTPILFNSQSLRNPNYAVLITPNPSPTVQAAALASALAFYNVAGPAYDASRVVALIDNSNRNAGRQRIHGVDLLAEYDAVLNDSGDRLVLTANASYLASDQQLLPGQPIEQRAGLLYNPPHWRARGGATWSGAPLTVNATLSYVGGVDDSRTTPAPRVGSMTTLDLTARYALPDSVGVVRGVEFGLSLRNAFDAKPTVIASTSFADTTYDSTNYSPIGRFLSFEVSKKW